MKRLIILCASCLATLPALGQLAVGHPTYDPFADATSSGGTSYTAGDNLAGQTSAGYAVYSPGAQQWWLRTGPGSGGTQPTISSENLTYAGLANGGGGSALFGPNGDTALMNLETASGGITPTIANTVYYSYSLKLTDLTGLSTTGVGITGGTQLQGLNGNNPPSWADVVMIRSDGGTGFNIGLDGGGKGTTAATLAWDSTSYSAGDTLFLVGAYNFTDAANSFANGDGLLWINPSASDFGAASAPAETLLSGGNNTALARIASIVLEQPADGPTGLLDDLRVGLTWADVTPVVPEPSAFALGALGLGFLCWRRFQRKSV